MRKLASIQKIIDVQAIPSADNIEVITVLGWHCVAKKGEFKIGDLCIYHEVDCLLPVTKDYEFLAKQGTKKSYVDGIEYTGYRLKTIRLKGQVSQGLALPLSILNRKKFPTDTRENPTYDFKEGDEVTTLLGIVKYEPILPAMIGGDIKGVFPANIPKTDETRLQSYPTLLQRYKDIPFYITEKMDGTSITIFLDENKELNVCSRNLNLKENDENTLWKVAKELNLKEKLANLQMNIALQGEVVGSGIQKNPLKLNGQKLYLFNIYDIDNGKYLDMEDFIMMCGKLGIERVPIVTHNSYLLQTVDEMVSFATRRSMLNGAIWAEGIVIRPKKEMRDPDLGRLSFKVLNPQYLLKYDA